MRRFAYSLSGGKLFPLFIGFYIPYLLCYAAVLAGSRWTQGGPGGRGAAAGLAVIDDLGLFHSRRNHRRQDFVLKKIGRGRA